MPHETRTDLLSIGVIRGHGSCYNLIPEQIKINYNSVSKICRTVQGKKHCSSSPLNLLLFPFLMHQVIVMSVLMNLLILISLSWDPLPNFINTLVVHDLTELILK